MEILVKINKHLIIHHVDFFDKIMTLDLDFLLIISIFFIACFLIKRLIILWSVIFFILKVIILIIMMIIINFFYWLKIMNYCDVHKYTDLRTNRANRDWVLLGLVLRSKRMLGLDLDSIEQSRSMLDLVSIDTKPSRSYSRFDLFCSGIIIYKHKP